MNESGPGADSDWAELTRECLLNIISRLSLEDRWRGVMVVCKSWLDASKDPSLLDAFDIEPWFDSPGVDCPRWWTPEFETKIDAMLRSVVAWAAGAIIEIRARHCSDRSLAIVAETCPKLEVLSIKSSMNVTDACMAKLALRCPMLVELDISSCYEISHESLELIGRNCPNLKCLRRNFLNWLDTPHHDGIVPCEYLNNCPQDGDLEASAIGKWMLNLEHLEIRFSKISARGLTLISEGCQNLTHLYLAGCVNLTSRDIFNAEMNLNNLKKIEKPNFYIPRSVFHAGERYGHWRLYDDRFQTDVFRI